MKERKTKGRWQLRMWLCCLYALVGLGSVLRAEVTLQLRSLRDAGVEAVPWPPQRPRVFVLFQPNCSACKQQLADLSCLKNAMTPTLIGAFAGESPLRQVARTEARGHLALYGTAEVLARLGAQPGVAPQTIIVSRDGRRRFPGVTPCSWLKAAYTDLAGL